MVFLPDDVVANVLSRLPGLEIARLRQVSSQFLHVSEKHYQKMALPIAMRVKLQFQPNCQEEIIVSIMTFHDTVAKKSEYPNCILCSKTQLKVFSHFQPAFYNFQRYFGVKPAAGNSSFIRIPVSSLTEALSLVLNWLKRNVLIGQLMINQDGCIINKEMIEEFKSFGKFVASRQVCPSLRWCLFVEFEEEYVEMLNTFNQWRCTLITPSFKLETLKKLTNPRLILQKPAELDSTANGYVPLFRTEEIGGLLDIMIKEWQERKRQVLEFRCRCEYSRATGYVWLAGMINNAGRDTIKKSSDRDLLISQNRERLVLYSKQCKKFRPTVDYRRLKKIVEVGE